MTSLRVPQPVSENVFHIVVAAPKPPLSKENQRKAVSGVSVNRRFYALHKGKHLLIDCRNVPRDLCLDDKRVLDVMARSAERAGATVISQMRYKFGLDSPPGFTAIVMLDESHCSAHTYADLGLIAMDVFTCGNTDPKLVFQYIAEELELGDVVVRELPRFPASHRTFEMPEEIAVMAGV
jgi:S-adenosylmethionine decarboxylase